ncbi:MAG: GtrA family protein [Bacteroidales bacterium]|nr:GtrA family protein [Bacteroidales bacterium]
MEKVRLQISELIRFCIVGCIATILHYVIYYVLKNWMNLNIAYIIGYGLSFICNYFLSSYFTFKKKANLKSGIGFSGAHLFNMLFQVVLLNVFTYIGISENIAPIPVYAIAIPVNFLMVRLVFKRYAVNKS